LVQMVLSAGDYTRPPSLERTVDGLKQLASAPRQVDGPRRVLVRLLGITPRRDRELAHP